MIKGIERLLAALAVMVLAGWAWADDKLEAAAGPDAAGLFKQLDANSDGFVTEDEVPADKQRLLRRLMRTADKDKDGKLSGEEFAAGLQGSRPERTQEAGAEPPRRPGGDGRPDPAALFRRMDTNGDGKVTKDEVPEERRERFGRMMELADRDGDGTLTLEEFTKVADRLPGRPGQGTAGARPQGRPGQGGPGERPDGPSEGDAVFRALDKDGDGKLSADEIRKATDSLAALDKDGDGSITIAELRRARPTGPSGSSDGGRPNPEMFVRRIMNGDKNGDGKLSQDELPERLRGAFERLDANHDGLVDEGELKAGLERLRSAAGQGNEARRQRPRNRPQENAKPATTPGVPAEGS
ncbi:MAG: EF-hand domain-containing protein [Planctomycetia bacterium]|nr:EF-hand domain-containing protein [Planctomycetia bacterium]